MKNQTDNNGYRHGYWEYYYPNGILSYKGNVWYKGNFINGRRDGYWRWSNSDGTVVNKNYFV